MTSRNPCPIVLKESAVAVISKSDFVNISTRSTNYNNTVHLKGSLSLVFLNESRQYDQKNGNLNVPTPSRSQRVPFLNVQQFDLSPSQIY